MPIASSPIYASDIIATSRPGSPVSVETRSSTNLDRPLAHGWLADAVVQPGFNVFAARYDSYADYNVVTTAEPGFLVVLNLGERHRADIPGRDVYLPSGHFSMISFDEPVPTKLHRVERKLQERCGIWLDWTGSILECSSGSRTQASLGER